MKALERIEISQRIELPPQFSIIVGDLFKLVKTYRLTSALDQRLRLGDEIFRLIEPKLRAFVFGSISEAAAADVLQIVLTAVATGLRGFKGNSIGEFWSWCYQIARFKIADHLRRRASDRLQPMSPDELRHLMDVSANSPVRTPGVHHDLEYAMKLLTSAKPECHALLWAHYVQDVDYADLAEERGLSYDAIRMKISRCLDEARALVA